MLAELDRTYGPSSGSANDSSIVKPLRKKRETSEDILTVSQIAALESDVESNPSQFDQLSASNADLADYTSLSPNDSEDEISTTEYTHSAVDFITTTIFVEDQETTTSLSQVNDSSFFDNSSVEEIAELPRIDIDSNLIPKLNDLTPSEEKVDSVSNEHDSGSTSINGTSAKLATYGGPQ